MRFDSFDPEHYRDYAKLNRYLISARAVTYNVQNCYDSRNLFSQKQVSVAIKNKRFECENYDKAAESGGRDPAYARLELRSKCLTTHKELSSAKTNRKMVLSPRCSRNSRIL